MCAYERETCSEPRLLYNDWHSDDGLPLWKKDDGGRKEMSGALENTDRGHYKESVLNLESEQ